ncbi:MAG: DUF3891 family protein [Acidobacteriota bacterium]|nr:DUF3891 family protein [Acidobacteriota bacterium]
MIVHEQDNDLVIVRQTDHALLSGFFAREWGNEEFSPPEPSESFRGAAAEHDNGWLEWELLPRIDPATFLPYSFMSIPTIEHIALYQRGIERILKTDHYAALLVSMHCSGLYDRERATMPGFSAKYVRSSESQMAADFVHRLRLQQLRLKVDLRGNPATKLFSDDKTLHANLQRLEAVDRLSLYVCLASQDDATIESVPLSEDGAETDWELTRDNDGNITLAPYPFRREPLALSILARHVPKRRYANDADFQNTLASANYYPVKCNLRRGKGSIRSLLAGA